MQSGVEESNWSKEQCSDRGLTCPNDFSSCATNLGDFSDALRTAGSGFSGGSVWLLGNDVDIHPIPSGPAGSGFPRVPALSARHSESAFADEESLLLAAIVDPDLFASRLVCIPTSSGRSGSKISTPSSSGILRDV